MITNIACHKATDDHHLLNFTYKNEEFEYQLETPMLMEFGLIHCCGAIQRVIGDIAFFFTDRETLDAANREIEALEACAQTIAAKKRNQTH
ncbi:hypothetical protein OTK49_20950 [Vibrio coralliirubri]|uniref:hypothetical protein n=1 Tax=Vibrio coralliirubri TaxID=1516159 RepID=UPI002283963C|nr:hypothetical protein [Vibrio coralliirubri]MCY9864988.1 hypothetical protein [Vibrio coralliirubri]